MADPGPKFSFSEVRLGLVPATISSVVIPKIGPGYARAYFSTGMVFDAAVAKHIGLVHEVSDNSYEFMDGFLKDILKAGPKAIAESKLIAQRPPMSADEAGALLAKVRASDEGKEGVGAFLEKRQADFVIGQSW